MPTTLEQFQYGFDRDSRRTWQRRALSTTQDQHYSYDSLSQVSAAARGSLNLNKTAISGIPANAQSWDYDPTGNWRGYYSAANGVSTLDQHRVHDRGNRLTQIEDNPNNMILDRVGRMRQVAPDASGDWDGKLAITWDAWSRVTSVKNNGAVVGEYAYDGGHRRVTREEDGETLHSYYNDAWRPVEERKDSETTATLSYLWGARHRDDLVRRDRATSGTSLDETRYILMDYFNPASITDETGEVKERYVFSAFGSRTILNPDFTVKSSSECGMEFAFQGQFLDGESGLMNYGHRYYSPKLGRWTCKDPIDEKGGINLYRISGNNPINSVDRFGLIDYSDRPVLPGYNWDDGRNFEEFSDEGMPCNGSSDETTYTLKRADRTNRFGIIAGIDLLIAGNWKDLRLRWWTCWRNFGKDGGCVIGCRDQLTCPVDGVWALTNNINSGPHITFVDVAFLKCECQQWKKVYVRSAHTFVWNNGRWE